MAMAHVAGKRMHGIQEQHILLRKCKYNTCIKTFILERCEAPGCTRRQLQCYGLCAARPKARGRPAAVAVGTNASGGREQRLRSLGLAQMVWAAHGLAARQCTTRSGPRTALAAYLSGFPTCRACCPSGRCACCPSGQTAFGPDCHFACCRPCFHALLHTLQKPWCAISSDLLAPLAVGFLTCTAEAACLLLSLTNTGSSQTCAPESPDTARHHGSVILIASLPQQSVVQLHCLIGGLAWTSAWQNIANKPQSLRAGTPERAGTGTPSHSTLCARLGRTSTPRSRDGRPVLPPLRPGLNKCAVGRATRAGENRAA